MVDEVIHSILNCKEQLKYREVPSFVETNKGLPVRGS